MKTTRLHHQPSRHRSQSQEDLCHHQHESSHLHQRCAEAHYVHGVLEQIHLKARRTGGYPSSSYLNTKRSLCGPQRRIKPWLSLKTSCPSHQSSQLLARRSSYCSTSLRLLMRSVLPSSLSGKKTARPIQSSDQSTSSARSFQNQRHATRQCKSYSTQCSSPRRSYDTTSRSIQLPLSPTTRSATSCRIKMLLEESPSGQSYSAPSTSTSSHAQPSSLKH
jgi:hypothetical protein